MKKIFPTLVAIFIALLPTYLIRFSIGPLPTTLLEVLFGVLVVCWLFTKPDFTKILNFKKTHSLIFWSGLIFLISATIALFIASDLREAAGLWKAYFVEPILFFIILFVSLERKDVGKIIWGICISALIISALAIAQFYFFPNTIPNEYWRALATRRATSIFEYPNAVGLYLAPIIPLLIYKAREFWLDRLKNLRKNLLGFGFFVITIGLALFSIILAGSMGAIIGLIGALIIFGLLYKKTRIATIIIILIAGITIPFTPLKDPLQQEFLLQNYSGKIRLQMWSETLEQLETTPLFGNGLASYQKAIAPFHKFQWAEIYFYPHNILLNFWTEIGIIGTVAFFIILFMGFVSAIQKRRAIVVASAAALLVILVHGLVDVPYLKNDLSMFFWFLTWLTLLK